VVNQLDALDPNTVIWRYLTFDKFSKLVSLRALWFARLGVFEDVEEGMTPARARYELKAQHQEMEMWFADERLRNQVRRFVEDNENSGRDMIVASCWFIGEHESRQMWDNYTKDANGVAVQSTIGALIRSLTQTHPNKWWVGRVKYIDRAAYEGMDAYTGSQAHLRAFLKEVAYAHENELRVATMNFVVAGCLNPDGSPPNEKQRRGFVDASDGPGIYVSANLTTLVGELRMAPGAEPPHAQRVESMLRVRNCNAPVRPSVFGGPHL
jgi:hypothetical protein